MENQITANDGTCDNTGCEELTPWDMPAIIINDAWFCSPNCAREHLEGIDAAPQSITFHDPQYAASRDELPSSVQEEDVDIRWPVSKMEDALESIQEIESAYPDKFRTL